MATAIAATSSSSSPAPVTKTIPFFFRPTNLTVVASPTSVLDVAVCKSPDREDDIIMESVNGVPFNVVDSGAGGLEMIITAGPDAGLAKDASGSFTVYRGGMQVLRSATLASSEMATRWILSPATGRARFAPSLKKISIKSKEVNSTGDSELKKDSAFARLRIDGELWCGQLVESFMRKLPVNEKTAAFRRSWAEENGIISVMRRPSPASAELPPLSPANLWIVWSSAGASHKSPVVETDEILKWRAEWEAGEKDREAAAEADAKKRREADIALVHAP